MVHMRQVTDGFSLSKTCKGPPGKEPLWIPQLMRFLLSVLRLHMVPQTIETGTNNWPDTIEAMFVSGQGQKDM